MENVQKETTPLDLLNPKKKKVDKEVQNKRLAFCKECKYFKPSLKQCSLCGCIMPLKVKLADSWCPVGYWISETPSN